MKLFCLNPSPVLTHYNPLIRLSACWAIALLGIVSVPGFSQQKRSDTESFGMRLRQLPTAKSAVYEPVYVASAPSNEATMIRRQNGNLSIFYINRPGEADKLLSISSADGIQWTEPVVEFALPGQAYYANRVLEDSQGVLHAIFHLWATGQNGYRGRHLDVWYCQKSPSATTWSQPRKILDGYVGSMRSFLQLRNGRMLMTFARANPERMEKPVSGQTDYGWNDVVALYSDDNGQHWKPSGSTVRVAIDNSMPVRYGGVEPNVIELADSRLWMLIRTNKGRLYESYSTDQGQTWSPAQPTRFISSDSPAELLRLSDQRLLLFFNSNQRWDNPHSYAAGGREVLHAAISRDDGKTWTGFREVLTMPSTQSARNAKSDRGTAYASAAETTDGNVALVAGQGEARSIVLFNPNWLDQTKAADNFANGLHQWTLYDADEFCQLTPLSPKQKVLQLTGSEAIWNFPALASGGIKMDLKIPQNPTSVSLTLTDHFSISSDSLAAQHGVVSFVVPPTVQTKTGKMAVEIRWDCKAGNALLYVNNRLIDQTSLRRKPDFGVNYLRIGPTKTGDVSSKLFLQSVSVIPNKETN
ncbi:BNR repeat protein [Larkinella arboricola]|uniref:BNR repeat protein n=1 Tax=Larkinella arboricola TaxID=643671 RepID=A0A327WPG5_LARAB|nr:sialidase family protein [Larkinella arboricola]RAJ93108.1 BNR repeat protein [Larkinella arboricola]